MAIPDGSSRDRLLFATAVAVNLVVVFAPTTGGVGGPVPHLDKVVHATVFGAVAASGLRVGLPAVGLALVLLVYAPVSEVLQHLLLPGRTGEAADVAADLTGVLVGLWGMSRLRHRGIMGS